MDLRVRVLAASDEGMGTAEVAETFLVSPAWVRRLKQRRRQTGEVAPRRPSRAGPALALEDHLSRLRALVHEHPDRTAAQYRDLLGLPVAAITVWRALKRLGLTFKKRSSGPPNKTARTWPPSGSTGGPR
jgi:transposase